MMLGIISAMREEQTGILSLMDEFSLKEIGGREFFYGTMYGVPVVLTISKIGKVSAATTAALLISQFMATDIIFTGTAGGIGKDVKVGDVVVSESFIQHDMNCHPIFPRYEVPLYGRTHFISSKELQERLAGASRTALAVLSTKYPHSKVHVGLVLTGDRFISTKEESQALVENFHGRALCVEMEGAAVAQVCYDHRVPYAAVRIISDRADDDAHESFTEFVTNSAAVFSKELINILLGDRVWPGDMRILAARNNKPLDTHLHHSMKTN